MKHYTYFDLFFYDFILFSLGLRDKAMLNYEYLRIEILYDDEFGSDFLNKYGYILYDENKILRKLFR